MSIMVFGVITAAYLFGSISSAIVICRILHLPDPRTQGSGNPGATNVLRLGGKKAAIITLLGDALKGAIPVAAAVLFGFSPLAIGLTALAAFLGHLYPLFFGFKGGKGVATFMGCLAVISWPAAIVWCALWLTMALLFRYASLASLTASSVAPICIWFFSGSLALTILFACMSLLLVYRHQNNIRALCAGKESKIGKKKSPH